MQSWQIIRNVLPSVMTETSIVYQADLFPPPPLWDAPPQTGPSEVVLLMYSQTKLRALTLGKVRELVATMYWIKDTILDLNYIRVPTHTHAKAQFPINFIKGHQQRYTNGIELRSLNLGLQKECRDKTGTVIKKEPFAIPFFNEIALHTTHGKIVLKHQTPPLTSERVTQSLLASLHYVATNTSFSPSTTSPQHLPSFKRL